MLHLKSKDKPEIDRPFQGLPVNVSLFTYFKIHPFVVYHLIVLGVYILKDLKNNSKEDQSFTYFQKIGGQTSQLIL